MLASVLKALGPIGIAIVAVFLYYEGVPIVNKIPLVAEIIPSGIIKGRVQSYADEQTRGLVSRFELETAQRTLARERQYRLAAENAASYERQRAAAAEVKATQRQEALERALIDAAKNEGLSRPNSEDLEWLRRN